MFIAEVAFSDSQDKFLQFHRQFNPGIEKFKALVFNLSIFLVQSCFDQWETYEILQFISFSL